MELAIINGTYRDTTKSSTGSTNQSVTSATPPSSISPLASANNPAAQAAVLNAAALASRKSACCA